MKDKLFTPSYYFILAANFLLFFGFWFLMPVLPFYLEEVFKVNESGIGVILACYTVASLCIRPFSGYMVDAFARKPLYLLAYFVFTFMFAGYIVAGVLTLFIIFRVIHGLAFGMVSVSGNTISGTPTSAGSFTVTVTASLSGHVSDTQTFTISVVSQLAYTNTPSNGVAAVEV